MDCLNKSPTQIIIFLEENEVPIGMIVGVITELPFSSTLVSSELAWWVEPEHRGKSSDSLRQAYEFWAKKQGCKIVTMSCLADETEKVLDVFYRRKGYTKAETMYKKEI